MMGGKKMAALAPGVRMERERWRSVPIKTPDAPSGFAAVRKAKKKKAFVLGNNLVLRWEAQTRPLGYRGTCAPGKGI